MTKEQIEGLARRIDLRSGAITEPMVSNAQLARLLAERAKLLEALRAAYGCCGQQACRDANNAALAFAEEEG